MRSHRHKLQYGLRGLWVAFAASLLGIVLSIANIVNAHEFKPTVAVLQFDHSGSVSIELSTNIEALIAGIGPDHSPAEFAKAARYAALRQMSPDDLTGQFNAFAKTLLDGIDLQVDGARLTLELQSSNIPDGTSDIARDSIITLKTTLPKHAKTLTWQWAKEHGVIALRLHAKKQQDVYNAYLEPGVKSEPFELSKLVADKQKIGQFLGAKPTEYPDWFKDSFLEFKDDVIEAAEAGKRLAIVFHQDNCPYCNLLIERNLSQQDIQQLMKDKLEVVAINIWGARELVSVAGKTYTEREFSSALKVQYTPTLLFFNEAGKLILRLNGLLEPAEFKRALSYVTGKHETTQSYAAFIAENRVKTASTTLNQQAFFTTAPYDLSVPEEGYDKPVAVFFEQSRCPNCDTLHQQVLADADTQAVIKSFQNIQLDRWSDTPIITPQGHNLSAKKWAEQLAINYTPTIVLFDKQGQEVIRLEAAFKTFHTQSTFDYVLSEAYKTQANFQKYLTHRADEIRESGKDVDIWK